MKAKENVNASTNAEQLNEKGQHLSGSFKLKKVTVTAATSLKLDEAFKYCL
jgi:hypothetical protein